MVIKRKGHKDECRTIKRKKEKEKEKKLTRKIILIPGDPGRRRWRRRRRRKRRKGRMKKGRRKR